MANSNHLNQFKESLNYLCLYFFVILYDKFIIEIKKKKWDHCNFIATCEKPRKLWKSLKFAYFSYTIPNNCVDKIRTLYVVYWLKYYS